MDEFGHFGYAVWFGLIEIIAKENGNTITGKLSISPTYLRRKLRSTPTKLRQVFDYCQTNARLTVNYSEKIWKFDFPKMAQIKDNYTKDLQETCKKPSNHKEVEEEEEVDKKKRKKIQVPDWISKEVWDGFVEMRKKMKAPMTEYAKELAFNKLLRFKNDGHDPNELINEATMKGWKSFYPSNQKQGKSQMQSNLDALEGI